MSEIVTLFYCMTPCSVILVGHICYNGRTDRRTDEQTDVRTHARTHGRSGDFIVCPMIPIALDRQQFPQLPQN